MNYVTLINETSKQKEIIMNQLAVIENETEETGKELIVLGGRSLYDVFKDGGSDPIIDEVEKMVNEFQGDISTEKGRKEIKSMAYKISRTKVSFDNMGKDLGDDYFRKKKAIDGERLKARNRFEALREKVLEPIKKWDERCQKFEDMIVEIQGLVCFESQRMMENPRPSLEEIDINLDSLELYVLYDWQEYEVRALGEIEKTRRYLNNLHSSRKKEIDDALELERLQKEEAERKQKEHDAEIARQAEEQARLDEQRKAKEEADRVANEQAEKDRIERERVQAEKELSDKKIRDAEQAKIDAETKAQEQADLAEKNRLAMQIKAENDLKRAEQGKNDAVEIEKRRHQAMLDAKQKAEKLREQDQAHRAKINNEIMTALKANTVLDEVQIKSVISLMARGKLPNVKINY